MANPIDLLMKLVLRREGVSEGLDKTKRELGEVEQEGKSADNAVDDLGDELRDAANAGQDAGRRGQKGLKDVGDQATKTDKVIGRLKGAVAGLFAAAAIKRGVSAFLSTADEVRVLDARLRRVTESEQEYQRAQAETFRIAQSSGQALSNTIGLYTKLDRSISDLGGTQEDALIVTEAVNNAVRLSGADAQASSAAITQFNQAIGSGVFRGEEFNSVLEQTPELARGIADGLGVTIGQLRTLANEGELTSEVVINALKDQSDSLREQAGTIPLTLSQVYQKGLNVVTAAVADFDEQQDITGRISASLDANLGTLAKTLAVTGDTVLAVRDAFAVSFNGIQIIVRSAAAAISEALALQTGVISRVLGALGLDRISEQFESASLAFKAASKSNRDALIDDFDDITNATGSLVENTKAALEDAGRSADSFKQKTTEATDALESQTDSSVKTINERMREFRDTAKEAADGAAGAFDKASSQLTELAGESDLTNQQLSTLIITLGQAASTGEELATVEGVLAKAVEDGRVSTLSAQLATDALADARENLTEKTHEQTEAEAVATPFLDARIQRERELAQTGAGVAEASVQAAQGIREAGGAAEEAQASVDGLSSSLGNTINNLRAYYENLGGPDAVARYDAVIERSFTYGQSVSTAINLANRDLSRLNAQLADQAERQRLIAEQNARLQAAGVGVYAEVDEAASRASEQAASTALDLDALERRAQDLSRSAGATSSALDSAEVSRSVASLEAVIRELSSSFRETSAPSLGGAGQRIELVVNLDGREVARAVAPHLEDIYRRSA